MVKNVPKQSKVVNFLVGHPDLEGGQLTISLIEAKSKNMNKVAK